MTHAALDCHNVNNLSLYLVIVHIQIVFSFNVAGEDGSEITELCDSSGIGFNPDRLAEFK